MVRIEEIKSSNRFPELPFDDDIGNHIRDFSGNIKTEISDAFKKEKKSSFHYIRSALYTAQKQHQCSSCYQPIRLDPCMKKKFEPQIMSL